MHYLYSGSLGIVHNFFLWKVTSWKIGDAGEKSPPSTNTKAAVVRGKTIVPNSVVVIPSGTYIFSEKEDSKRHCCLLIIFIILSISY